MLASKIESPKPLYTFTVCHKDFGYIAHSIILAENIEDATIQANEKFQTVRSVMKK